MAVAVLTVQQEFDVGLVAVPLVVALNAAAGLYRRRLAMSVLDDILQLAARGIVALLLTLALAASLQAGVPFVGVIAGLGAAAAIDIGFVAAARAFLYETARRARRNGPRPVVIVGGGKIADRIAARLTDRLEYGLKPVGYLDALPLYGPERHGVPVLGGTDDLAQVIVEQHAYDVIIAFGSFREHEVLAAVETCRRLGCDVFCVPRFFELQGVQGSRWAENLWGLPLVRLPRRPHASPAWRVKRVIDIVGAATGLVATAPLLGACALAVRAEGGPGVLFRQNRVGLDGHGFTVLKFRTLRPADDDESATRWSIAHDDRLGPVGRVLRRTSLDELPQLWNILRGDMSIVGPRPERPHFVAEFTQAFPGYGSRHRVPAGLTGLAQVNGLRGDTSIEERARFDNLYIENWSLWQDIKIILRTVLAPLRRSGG
jgi:exopolysaccharide biosynthesis polyprenyl glycosylphosphotransferase